MKHSTIRRISFSLTTILVIILCWSILSFKKQGNFLYPSIIDIFQEIVNGINKSNLFDYSMTLLRVLIAVSVSLLLSLIVIILYIRFKDSISFFTPITTFFKTVPFISVSLFIILLFSRQKFLGLISISIILTFPIGVETLKSGVDSIPRYLTDDLQTLDIGFFRKVFKVYLPLLMPHILLVFLETLGLGFKVMIMAEYFMQTKNSVGMLIYRAKNDFDMAKLIAYSSIIILIVGLSDVLIKIINNRLKIEY